MNLMTIDSQIEKPNGTGLAMLHSELRVPSRAAGLVIFCPDGESDVFDPRNQTIARAFQENHLGTLLFAREENSRDFFGMSGQLRQMTAWAAAQEKARGLPIGYFGAYSGAAAVLTAAAALGARISNVVCCGGALDRAESLLDKVKSPTLLIVGGRDIPVIEINQNACRSLRCEKSIAIVPRASHWFEEPGALPAVARIASEWFLKHFQANTYFFIH